MNLGLKKSEVSMSCFGEIERLKKRIIKRLP